MMAQNDLVVVGIDVAKDKVDACIRSLSQRQGRQILATLGGQFETMMDRISRRHRVRCVVRERRARTLQSISKKGEQGASSKRKQARLQKKKDAKRKKTPRKKSRAFALLQKLCRPYFPENLDLILIDGTTLLLRARAPPETWTTRLEPLGKV
jgi:hypothetical protein